MAQSSVRQLPEDARLAREALAGSRWAQREIWYRYAPMVHSFLRRTLGRHHEPEDLEQEVFLRVFQHLDSLRDPDALRSFVYSIAVRVVSEELRRSSVRARLRVLFPSWTQGNGPAAMDMEARDLLARIQGVLDQMNHKHRAVFVLRRLEGMPLGEIASGLDLSLATVKRYLDKAMAVIEQALGPDSELRGALERHSPLASNLSASDEGAR